MPNALGDPAGQRSSQALSPSRIKLVAQGGVGGLSEKQLVRRGCHYDWSLMRNNRESLKMWGTGFPSNQHPHGVGGWCACCHQVAGRVLGEVSRLHSLPSCRHRD